MRKKLIIILSLVLTAAIMLSMPVIISAEEEYGTYTPKFTYRHDPRLNEKAMEDIIVDPDAVYGFSPDPNGSLALYTSFDWTDPEFVNGDSARLERIAYHESMKELYDMIEKMVDEKKSIEEIARAVSTRRNELRLEVYTDNPEGLELAKQRNLEKYGHEEGPLPDELYEKYGSWGIVMQKALSSNAGMDACLGLYDDCYDLYVMTGMITDEKIAAATREYTVASFIDASMINLPDTVDVLDAFADGEEVSEWYAPEMAAAISRGILKGYEDTTLRPKNTITRLEACVLLSRCIPEMEIIGDPVEFSDVPEWAEFDVDRLSSAGIVKGYGNGKLGASDLLTVEQVGILVERIRDYAGRDLSLWTNSALAKEALVSYVKAVTDPDSQDYIPVEDRIAVFDFDGTLFCETDPNYFDYTLLKYRVLEDPEYKDIASDFEKEVANKIKEQNETGKSFTGLEVDHGRAVASAFRGMTLDEFSDYIQEFKKQPMPSYEGMLRGDGWYLPMLQIVDYLKKNDFTVYIISGTDRLIVRGIALDSPIDLKNRYIIGSDETIVSSNQGDKAGLDYQFDKGDELILGGDFIIKNLKMNKVSVIMQEIGQQPVLSFGNSTGDSSMAEFVISGNPYRSLAFMLCCDDTERENGNLTKAQKMYDLCDENGWIPISMKNDWTTIYGDGVTYTGNEAEEDIAA